MVIFFKTRNGNDSIFVVVDYLSKRAHFIATKIKIDSAGLAKLFMDNIFKHDRLPDTIVSDRDPRFVSSFYCNLHRLLGTKLAMTSANHAVCYNTQRGCYNDNVERKQVKKFIK